MVAFAHSVIGASHVKNGQPCQDASLCVKNEAYTLIAVADGHGGERYFRSDIGSRFAVEAADFLTEPAVLDVLRNVKREEHRESIILQLKKSIINLWNMNITVHVENNPFTEDELNAIPEKYAERYRGGEQIEAAYGSTLIAVLLTEKFILAMQIGDGNAVTVDNAGMFAQPIPADENCFLNVTTSLCDENAIESFRHSYSDISPVAVLIGTDGIDDCFAGAEKLFDFYRVVLTSFRDKDEETAKTELIDYLPRLSEKGSGDDISIGMMIDKELLQAINIETPKQETDRRRQR